MILKIILVLVIVAFIAVVINGVEDYNSHNRTNKLSFKEIGRASCRERV